MTTGGPHSERQGEASDRDPLSRLFAAPTDQDRARLRAGLLGRAALVRANGWAPYRGLWSTGELIGVAALLGEHGELAGCGETLESTWQRWAFDLWGLDEGQDDVDNDCAVTRQWFLDSASEFEHGYGQLALEFNCRASCANQTAAGYEYIHRTEAHRGANADCREDAE